MQAHTSSILHSLPSLPPQRPFSPLSPYHLHWTPTQGRGQVWKWITENTAQGFTVLALLVPSCRSLPPHSTPSGTRLLSISLLKHREQLSTACLIPAAPVAHTEYQDCIRFFLVVPVLTMTLEELFCYYCCYPQYSSTTISGHIYAFSIIALSPQQTEPAASYSSLWLFPFGSCLWLSL